MGRTNSGCASVIATTLGSNEIPTKAASKVRRETPRSSADGQSEATNSRKGSRWEWAGRFVAALAGITTLIKPSATAHTRKSAKATACARRPERPEAASTFELIGAGHRDDVVSGVDEMHFAGHAVRKRGEQIKRGPANILDRHRAPKRG